MNCAVVVPWHRKEQLNEFCDHWMVVPSKLPDWLILQQDVKFEGSGATKNKGIAEAMDRNADVVVVLDDDCFPSKQTPTLDELKSQHIKALEMQPVTCFEQVTVPASRGTPYNNLTVQMPVAASIGFWEENGDHCAVRQLALNNAHMSALPKAIHGNYFALCGMNIAFKPKRWLPWCRFIEVARFDDIWMGWLWQKAAYSAGYCFNVFGGPTVTHSRQSNVWKNLRAEAMYLEESETLWGQIAQATSGSYKELCGLLPVSR